MGRLCVFVSAAILAFSAVTEGQTRRTPPRRPPAPPPPPTKVSPDIVCPTPLGVGVTSKTLYCDVMSGRDPAEGILIPLPPHTGVVTLSFDLHNRHTYSEQQVRQNQAFARYTATVGVLTMDNTLISRAVVQNEFRKAGDLVERIGGGAGPGGLKAVAPTGTERIVIAVPEEEMQVSLLGEKLQAERLDGVANYTSPGRPIAVISNVEIEYVPAPPPKPAAPPRPRRPAAR